MAPSSDSKSHQQQQQQQQQPEKKAADKPTLLESINPWGSMRRSTTSSVDAGPPSDPVASSSAISTATATTPGAAASATPREAAATPQDHSSRPFYGRSFRTYPAGCPPLNVQWFHAVDVPKRKAEWFKGKKVAKEEKPTGPPKKYVAFSTDDNRAFEAAYQKVLEDIEAGKRPNAGKEHLSATVPVNEDFLFDVIIEDRELTPVYWLGPVYDVRRASWFYQEGSTLRPCEENLAAQLEEGYLKLRPWQAAKEPADAATSAAGIGGAVAAAAGSGTGSGAAASGTTGTSAAADIKAVAGNNGGSGPPPADATPTATSTAATLQPQTHRLFGQYMNHVATYQDATTAWLSTDGMLSWVTSTMYERFSGGGYMSGVKLVRGYSEPKKSAAKDDKQAQQLLRPETPTADLDEKKRKALKRRSAPASTKPSEMEGGSETDHLEVQTIRESNRLQRQLSSLVSSTAAGSTNSGDSGNKEEEEEAIRKRGEEEMEDDYTGQSGETQGREIEHLVLVVHGIGQLLGIRMESMNFIHDVNMLRKTLKSVYAGSSSLRTLNGEPKEGGPGNCRIQVLPVCWRHLLDFPKRTEERRQEQDLSDMAEEEDEYPALDNITIEGMAFARSLISDLALDVLLFQSDYRHEISEIVLRESNRIHRLFRERNPNFQGTVHLIGHSLGSAILFDILCQQKSPPTAPSAAKQPGTAYNALRPYSAADDGLMSFPRSRSSSRGGNSGDNSGTSSPMDRSAAGFDFDVGDFYCLGSPVGLFQMLEGRTIAARPEREMIDLTGDIPVTTTVSIANAMAAEGGRPVSSPRVAQLYNVFHPSDPISYRLEPLIAPAMSSLKPQALPYTKRGIFDSMAPQGLTGIGAKVGQSVSGLWSSLSAGIASNLLNRSLGFSQEEVARLQQQQQQLQQKESGKGNASGKNSGTNAAGANNGGSLSSSESVHVIPDTSMADGEVETLFSHFQKNRANMLKEEGGTSQLMQDPAARWKDEKRAQRMRREEAKVRALNRNGRVDYSIQESVLDFNPMNTIASHMAYWADVDVSHFIMSQLLSRMRVTAGGVSETAKSTTMRKKPKTR